MIRIVRWIGIVAIVVIVAGCKQKSGGGTSADAGKLSPLLSELESLGFYKYASAGAKAQQRGEAASTAFIFGSEELGRAYPADAEALAEGGVGEFLSRIGPALEVRGVRDLAVSENPEGPGGAYVVTINERPYEMYSASELESGDIWQLATGRAFAAVNQLLADAGSDERLYWLYGDNDNLAVFLTEAQHRAIVNSGLLDTREIPVPVGLPASAGTAPPPH